MIFRKSKRDTLSEIFAAGGAAAAGDSSEGGHAGQVRDVDPLAVLRANGINTDLIPDSLLPTITSSFAMNTDDSNENARIKVECVACNRPVAYGRGKCMYCGKPLELPESARSASDDASGETGLDFDLGGSL
jgi:hypothetical protein